LTKNEKNLDEPELKLCMSYIDICQEMEKEKEFLKEEAINFEWEDKKTKNKIGKETDRSEFLPLFCCAFLRYVWELLNIMRELVENARLKSVNSYKVKKGKEKEVAQEKEVIEEKEVTQEKEVIEEKEVTQEKEVIEEKALLFDKEENNFNPLTFTVSQMDVISFPLFFKRAEVCVIYLFNEKNFFSFS
jgi:hypothetical protein